MSKAFVIVADSRYFEGLWALLNSVLIYHQKQIQVILISHGLSSAHMKKVNIHPIEPQVHLAATLPFAPAGAWEAKQQVFGALLEEWQTVFLLDADLVITSPLDDVFEQAEAGYILAPGDGPGKTYGPEYSIYYEGLVGRTVDYLATGCVCMDGRRHWDLAGLWSFSSRYGRYSPRKGVPLGLPGHGDQGLFNALARRLGKDEWLRKLPEAEWTDATLRCPMEITTRHPDGRLTVTNGKTGKRQRVVHCTGPKWWGERGRANLASMGQKLEVFEHFYNGGKVLTGLAENAIMQPTVSADKPPR
jgi:hypothetical protein